jgi:hypothetical protein
VALNGEPSGGHKGGRAEARGRSSVGGGGEREENPTPPSRTCVVGNWRGPLTGGPGLVK